MWAACSKARHRQVPHDRCWWKNSIAVGGRAATRLDEKRTARIDKVSGTTPPSIRVSCYSPRAIAPARGNRERSVTVFAGGIIPSGTCGLAVRIPKGGALHDR